MQISISLLRPWWAALVAALLLLAGCAPATDNNGASSSPIREQSWWLDRSGKATLDDVQAVGEWQSFSGWKSLGFGAAPLWVRLRLRAGETGDGFPWVLTVRPAFLDHLTLYDPATGKVLRGGDAISPTDDALVSLNFTFALTALPNERDVFLRLESTSARTVHLAASTFKWAQQQSQRLEWLLGFMLSISLMFMLWASLQWWQTREVVMGAFAVNQAITTIWGFFFLGFARIIIGPALAPGVLTALASSVLPWLLGSSLWFMGLLLASYHPSRLLLRACFGVAAAFLLLPLMQFAGSTREMLMISNAAVPAMLVLLVATLLSATRSGRKPPIPLVFLLAYMCLYGSLNAIPPLIYLGLIEESPFVAVGNLSNAVMNGLMMVIILHFRSRAMQREQRQTALELVRSQEQTEAAKRQHEEQSQLFSMLAHEIKTPLASLRMWMDAGLLNRETMERAITDMDQTIERCVQTAQLADKGLRPVLHTLAAEQVTQSCIQACRAPHRVDFSGGEWPPLLADAQMLSIVLGNLLDNACKYSAAQSRVLVSVDAATENGRPGLRWRVANTAGNAGLPDATRLFEKYYRSPHARRQSGSGLGLYLVKGLVDLMQGRVAYEYMDDRVIFSLWLPLVPAPG